MSAAVPAVSPHRPAGNKPAWPAERPRNETPRQPDGGGGPEAWCGRGGDGRRPRRRGGRGRGWGEGAAG